MSKIDAYYLKLYAVAGIWLFRFHEDQVIVDPH